MKSLGEYLNENIAVMVYFTTPGCSTCKGLKPKIKEMADREFPLIKYVPVDVSENPEIAAEVNVYSAPTILVYFEGKEYIRESRFVSVDQLEAKIRRYYNFLL